MGFPPSLLIIQIISLTSFWIRVNTNTRHDDNTQVSSRMNLKRSKYNFWLAYSPDVRLFILLFVSDGVELEFVDLWTPYNTYCYVYNSRKKKKRYTKEGRYIYTHYLFHPQDHLSTFLSDFFFLNKNLVSKISSQILQRIMKWNIKEE